MSRTKTPAFERTGVPSDAELESCLPPAARFEQGPVVVVECFQRIPCNPCVDACARRVITVEPTIIELPRVDFERCNGCAVCVARCPGLAIFVVHKNYSATEATVALPYELLPRPRPGAIVAGLDRRGERVCDARVIKVQDARALDRCAIITVAVPKRFYNTVRSIRVETEAR